MDHHFTETESETMMEILPCFNLIFFFIERVHEYIFFF